MVTNLRFSFTLYSLCDSCRVTIFAISYAMFCHVIICFCYRCTTKEAGKGELTALGVDPFGKQFECEITEEPDLTYAIAFKPEVRPLQGLRHGGGGGGGGG